MAREREEGWASSLGSGAAALAGAPAPIGRLVAGLVAPKAATRLAALDAVGGALLTEGEVGEHAQELLPHLISLATAPRYPEAAALLVRLTGLMAAIDAPPRSLAAGGGEPERRVHGLLAARLPDLLRAARSSTSPEASRIAACLCARFPDADAQVEPILIALLSGSRDPDERARLLYSLTRVQASRGAELHRRVADALQGEELHTERLAVLLAITAHDPPEPLRARAVDALERARDAGDGFADPTAWGRTLSARSIERALAELGGG
jgi:hypothetical protein